MAKKDYPYINISDLKKNALSIFFKYKGIMKKKGHRPLLGSKIQSQKLMIQIGSSGLPGLIGLPLRKLKKKLERQNLM
jgi:hypothetical protein